MGYFGFGFIWTLRCSLLSLLPLLMMTVIAGVEAPLSPSSGVQVSAVTAEVMISPGRSGECVCSATCAHQLSWAVVRLQPGIVTKVKMSWMGEGSAA